MKDLLLTSLLRGQIEHLLAELGLPEAGIVLHIGSSRISRLQPNDFDILIISKELQCTKRFILDESKHPPLEIEVIGVEAARSYVNNYFWYPDNLAGELGKLQKGRVLFINTKAEDFHQLYSELSRPRGVVRDFILTYHLGTLLRLMNSAESSDRCSRYHVCPDWSIISVLASLWNDFPGSMKRNRILEEMPSHRREVCDDWLADLPYSSESRWRLFLEYVHEVAAMDDDLRNAWNMPRPNFYPQNLEGLRELGEDVGTADDRIILFWQR